MQTPLLGLAALAVSATICACAPSVEAVSTASIFVDQASLYEPCLRAKSAHVFAYEVTNKHASSRASLHVLGSSCGCTEIEIENEVIYPGQTGIVRAVVSTGSSGSVSGSLTIGAVFDGTEEPAQRLLLRFSGNVLLPQGLTAAPETLQYQRGTSSESVIVDLFCHLSSPGKAGSISATLVKDGTSRSPLDCSDAVWTETPLPGIAAGSCWSTTVAVNGLSGLDGLAIKETAAIILTEESGHTVSIGIAALGD